MEPGAAWLGMEVNRFGRSARDERFLRGEWWSNVEVWQEGKPLWIDRQYLLGSQEAWESPHALAGQPVVGTMVWLGREADATWLETARALWDEMQGLGEAGVSLLPAGLICRYRGPSSSEAMRWFLQTKEGLTPAAVSAVPCAILR